MTESITEFKQTVKFVHPSVEYKLILWNITLRYRDNIVLFNRRIRISCKNSKNFPVQNNSSFIFIVYRTGCYWYFSWLWFDIFALTFHQVSFWHFDRTIFSLVNWCKQSARNRSTQDEPEIFGSNTISEAIRSESSATSTCEQKAHLQKNGREWQEIWKHCLLWKVSGVVEVMFRIASFFIFILQRWFSATNRFTRTTKTVSCSTIRSTASSYLLGEKNLVWLGADSRCKRQSIIAFNWSNLNSFFQQFIFRCVTYRLSKIHQKIVHFCGR